MRLLNLHIRNFRKIKDLSMTFPKGLTVMVGENNAGKTTVIDALRLMLFSSRDFEALRLNEDDFRRGSENAPIEISCTFCDLTDADEVHLQECLVDIGDGQFHVRLSARAEFNTTTRRVNVKMWGGETEGGSLPSNLYDRLSSIYLQPLRDPESGLRPGNKWGRATNGVKWGQMGSGSNGVSPMFHVFEVKGANHGLRKSVSPIFHVFLVVTHQIWPGRPNGTEEAKGIHTRLRLHTTLFRGLLTTGAIHSLPCIPCPLMICGGHLTKRFLRVLDSWEETS